MTSLPRSAQPPTDKLLAELIKKIRNTNNLTQAAFGQLFQPSVAQSTVARWEKGEQVPDRSHFDKIASLIDLTLEELLELIDKPSTDIDDFKVENKTLTHNKRHLAMLKKGARAWNRWRKQNPYVIPQLSGIDLSCVVRSLSDYSGLEGYNLDRANLAGIKSRVARFKHASLVEANLEKAELRESDFEGADLTQANLKGIVALDTNFDRAILREADLNEATIRFSSLIEASLEKVNASKTELIHVDLSRAILNRANFSNSRLIRVNLTEANLNEASLEKATIENCSAYGVSLLGTKFNGTRAETIYLSPEGREGVPVNDLEMVQVAWLHRYYPDLTRKLNSYSLLEEEVVQVVRALVVKHGEYFYNKDEYVYLNIDACTRNENRPSYQIVKNKEELFVKTLPELHLSQASQNKFRYQVILSLAKGITESFLSQNDLENLKEIAQLEAKNQNRKIYFIAPLVAQILELSKSQKISGSRYNLEKDDKKIILKIGNEVELMRVEYCEGQWIATNSSLSDNDLKYFQGLEADIEHASNYQTKENIEAIVARL